MRNESIGFLELIFPTPFLGSGMGIRNLHDTLKVLKFAWNFLSPIPFGLVSYMINTCKMRLLLTNLSLNLIILVSEKLVNACLSFTKKANGKSVKEPYNWNTRATHALVFYNFGALINCT